MTATAQKYDPQKSGSYNEQYQNRADTDHLKKLMRRDITGFYNRLSVTGRRILAALMQSAPVMDKPFPFVITRLQHGAMCSRLSVLRTVPRERRPDYSSGRFTNPDAGTEASLLYIKNAASCS